MPVRRKPLRQDYASLAEILADNLPKPLKAELADALGIELAEDDGHPLGEQEQHADETEVVDHELHSDLGVLAEAHRNGNDPLLHEVQINHDWKSGDSRAPVEPSLIARAQLYDAVMLHHDRSFKHRFDGVFGKGAADQVLAGG